MMRGFDKNRLLSGASTHLSSPRLVWSVSAASAIAIALPAVWWQMLHEDEVVTVDIAPRPFDEIIDIVFVNKGGAPLHFFLEHVFLAWPGGVEGLRIPSLVFFLLALPAAGLAAERLAGRTAALVLVPALALAPLAVNLATFGRMYSLFLAATLWTTLLAFVAAERAQPLLWGIAGALLGLLVYVHPIAPLYIGTALLSALVYGWNGLRPTLRAAWPAPVAIVGVGLPFYLHSLSVLRERYDVYRGGERVTTNLGDSVPELALEALVPGGWPGRIAFSLLAIGGIVALARSRPRSTVIVLIWTLIPVLFFTLVPAERTAFFPRYLLPTLPFALLAVVVGIVALGRSPRLGAAGRVAASLAVVSLLAAAAYQDIERLRSLSSLELPELVRTVAPHRDDSVLFSSLQVANLDRYAALEIEGLRRVESRCSQLVPFLADSSARDRGIWFLTSPAVTVARRSEQLPNRADVRLVRIGSAIMLAISTEAMTPRELIAVGLDLRAAWFADEKSELATLAARHETLALRGECPEP